MVLKRKRSDSEMISFSSALSSPPRPGSFNFDAIAAMDTARRGFFAPRLPTSSHLPSRTMKRFRDNRPPEEIIHQHTLNLLYSAQQHPNQQPHPESQTQLQVTSISSASLGQRPSTQQQKSLHSFWNIPGRVVASSEASITSSPSPSPPPSESLYHQSHSSTCDDCGVGLRGSSREDGDDDVIMGEDEFAGGIDGHTCGACGKAVCFSCSISNLGEHRRCLACAGRR